MYDFVLRDHLGNGRVYFTDRNFDGVCTASDVLQDNHYYPFGMNIDDPRRTIPATTPQNQYQYNGKELNEDWGLHWNDYGARFYDPAVGRWWSVDKLAIIAMSQSSYSYASCNPIKYIDILGLASSEYYFHYETGTYRNQNHEIVDPEVAVGWLKDQHLYNLPKVYYVNLSKKSTSTLLTMFNYAADIFHKNGIDGVLFEQRSVEEAMQYTETPEFTMFLAIVQVRNIVNRSTNPGTAYINKTGTIGVYDKNTINEFPYNGFLSYIDLENPVISEHAGNRVYAAGYIIAHELLHQLVGIAGYYTKGDGTRYNFHRQDPDNPQHLNQECPTPRKAVPKISRES